MPMAKKDEAAVPSGWVYEGGDCPRYLYGFPFGIAYVEGHGSGCMAKLRPGVWTFHCKALGLYPVDGRLKAGDGPGACREANGHLAKRLDELRAGVEERRG